MSSEKSEAIVLRAVPWSETSFVVTLFTRHFGKVSAVAKGARRLRSPFESSLDLLAKSQIVFIQKSNDTLDILTESKLIRRFRSAQISLLPLYCGYYVAELLLTVTEEHQKVADLFEMSDRTLMDLDAGKSPPEVVLRFEMQLLKLLGHLPTFHLCASCGNAVESQRNGEGTRLGIAAGGVLCPNCLPGQRFVLRIRNPTLGYLISYATADWDQEPEPIDSEYRGEMRFVMERFISNLADRRLRLTDFLEELQR
ncbi:MAG: DNA repair protein RecO [Planctomycetota bacterium]|nr:DNA repair protein RecO [Planctomycetota bacterium]